MPTLRDTIAAWWIRNANIRHGHLPDEALQGFDPEATTKRSSWLPTILAGAAGLLAGPAGYAIANWLTADDAPAAVAPLDEAPAFQPPGSLYQYLEDHGLHLPEKAPQP